MTTIEPETLKEQVANGGDLCVVDIRPEDDYDENHIEGSENRPIRKKLLAGNVEEALAELEDLPDDKELVMVCDAGVASTETARVLQDKGQAASALEGGMNAWNLEQEEQ